MDTSRDEKSNIRLNINMAMKYNFQIFDWKNINELNILNFPRCFKTEITAIKPVSL
jgi:hypothetical protein